MICLIRIATTQQNEPNSVLGETVQNQPSESMLGLHQEESRTVQTVSFNEDGSVATLELNTITPMQDYLLGANDSLTNDIKGFLSRPVPIGNIVWKETDGPGTDIFEPNLDAPANSGYDLPDTWLSIPMIDQKIQGFSFLRCSFKVRLQFNAQPFNAGRVILYFYPFANNFSENTSVTITSTVHFGGITGYRHVDLDLSTATSAELTIPYIGLVSHHNLVHNKSSMGRVRCVVYSKLTSGASEAQTTVDGTVWVHAEDIDLQMPTGVNQLTSPRRVTAHANDKEKQQPAKGTIETLANATSSICEQVGRIPGLAEMANGVRWVSDFVGGVAGIFGWSRPTDPSFSTLVQPSYVRHMANFNGDAKSKPMGLDARNEIETPLASFTTNDDEMSMAAVLSRPVFIDRFSMSQSQVSGTNLWRWPVTPSACTKSVAGPGYAPGTIFHHTFLSYLARLFKFWRGTFNYHFKVVKTSFHSGRIRVFFVPLADLSTDVAHVDFDKCYNKIYDIRDTAEFDFAIPFVSNTVWRNLVSTVSVTTPLDITSDVPSGMIYVQVLNQLRNPSVASDTIEFLVETSAGEDFQFAFLTQTSEVKPVRIAGGFVSFVSDDEDRYVRRVKAQCDDFFSTNKMKGYNPNVLGIGEAVTSLRQLLKRYGRYPKVLPAVSSDTKLNVIRVYDTNDSFAQVGSSDQGGPCNGLFDYVSFLYRMQAGSMRMMFIPSTPNVNVYPNIFLRTYQLDPYPVEQTSYFREVDATTWPEVSTSLPAVKFFEIQEGSIELDVPFYQPYPVQMTNLGRPTPADAFSEGFEQPYNFGTEIAINNDSAFDVFRSIGEDFSFGYLVGPPLGLYVTPTPSESAALFEQLVEQSVEQEDNEESLIESSPILERLNHEDNTYSECLYAAEQLGLLVKTVEAQQLGLPTTHSLECEETVSPPEEEPTRSFYDTCKNYLGW